MLTQLVHNGIIIAPKPPRYHLVLTIRDNPIALTALHEEMALAWARKQGTPYVEDRVFVANFMTDFSAALDISPPLTVNEVGFEPALRIIQAERAAKAALTKEERKAAAAVRKVKREELKERYGYAIVDGERVELGNYITEPSGIFMGRGQHPLRGRWKEGAAQGDVTLNLSPDADHPEGAWKEIVWQSDSLWVARWKDKLSGKMKYVWLSDTAPIKQEREAQKFDQGTILGQNLEQVRAQIRQDLASPDLKIKNVATACYLIDHLCLRVGDEKDPDEADTIGATTLRPEHIKLHQDGSVEFKFLGKDSVLWHKKLVLPEIVRDNLEALIENARPSDNNGNGNHPTRDLPQLFPDISSRNVNNYLSEILPGLSAKVFRTHHGMWKFHDRTHPKHEPGNRYQHAIRDYYVRLDEQIGTLLERIPKETLVMVTSDHGVKGMHGGICVNEWLRREGLLTLEEEPEGEELTPFGEVEVDWARTRVWGSGGYYARIFMNVEGREPQGTIPADQYEAFRDQLAERIRAIPAPDGSDIGTVVFKPQEIYREVRNIPPDLIVYFGNLSWRSVGSFGHGGIYTFENDTGPDDANHAENGMFILVDPGSKLRGERVSSAPHLMDVAPTILDVFGLPIPADMQGKVIRR